MANGIDYHKKRKILSLIYQKDSSMKNAIKKILFILKLWIEQHHEFERWHIRNRNK